MYSSDPVSSPPLAEQSTIDTTKPIRPEESAPEEQFDSQDNPDVKQHFSPPRSWVRRPAKPSPKPASRKLSPSASTDDRESGSNTTSDLLMSSDHPASSRAGSEVDDVAASPPDALLPDQPGHDEFAASEDPASSRSGGEVNEGSTPHRTNPSSKTISIPMGLSNSELERDLVKAMRQKQQLQKDHDRISLFYENEKELRVELERERDSLETSNSKLEQANGKLENQYTELEAKHNKAILKNNDLNEENKYLRVDFSRLQQHSAMLVALNATQANQMQTNEDVVVRKENYIKKLEKDLKDLKKKHKRDISNLEKDFEEATEQLKKEQLAENAKNVSNLTEESETVIQKLQQDLQKEEAKNVAVTDELENVRGQERQLEKQQMALEDKMWLEDGGVTGPPFASSPAYSSTTSDANIRGWDPLAIASRKPQVERLSNLPALADKDSILPTPSFPTSNLPDLANPSELPKANQEITLYPNQSNSSSQWLHENVYRWPSDAERRPYRIVGPRPKDSAEAIKEIKALAPRLPEPPSSPSDSTQWHNATAAPVTMIDDSARPKDLGGVVREVQTPAPTLPEPPSSPSNSAQRHNTFAAPVTTIDILGPKDLGGASSEVQAPALTLPEPPSSPSNGVQRYNAIAAPVTMIDNSDAPLSISTHNAATQTDVLPVAAASSTTTESGTTTADSVVAAARNISTESDCQTVVIPMVAASTTTIRFSIQSTELVVVTLPWFGSVTVKVGRPLWHYVVLGSLLLIWLSHVYYAERKLWMDANELSRRAVVSMRDEWWGSPWVEKLSYVLEQALAVDRTGFC
jgi:hypothetical protein